MTQKEINKFLANTKVYVNGKSKEIQEKLLSFGFCWGINAEVSHTEKPFLYLSERKGITCGDDMKFFTEDEYREITAKQILALKLTEPTYRPFKDKEECWNEMLKHTPFGWIIYDKTYRNLIEAYNYSVTFTNDNKEINSPFPAALINIKFADGTPFGIKEEIE